MGTFHQQVDPNLTSGHPNMPLFSSDLSAEYVQYPYAYDIQVALLRTRYYYAKFMVYRPFVYKALHFPSQISPEDAEGVAECLRVSFMPYFNPLHNTILIQSLVLPEVAAGPITSFAA